MTRFSASVRGFFGILLQGRLPAGVAAFLGLAARPAKTVPDRPVETASPSDGALQILAILQRDARLIDFLMEDISGYSDQQVGAATRPLHEQCRQSLDRHLRLAPVIDGVEGTSTRLGAERSDPSRVKLLGKIPAAGAPEMGLLRHRGWRALNVNLPPIERRQDLAVIAPAEVELE